MIPIAVLLLLLLTLEMCAISESMPKRKSGEASKNNGLTIRHAQTFHFNVRKEEFRQVIPELTAEDQFKPSHKQRVAEALASQAAPNLAEQQQMPSLYQGQQMPSLYQGQQMPSLYQGQQMPSLYQGQQMPSLYQGQSSSSALNLAKQQQMPLKRSQIMPKMSNLLQTSPNAAVSASKNRKKKKER